MAFPGELFLRLASVVVIPSLTSMLVAGVASAGLAAARRMGLWALAFYLVSKTMAIAVAYALAVSLEPGNPARRIEVPDVRPTRGEIIFVDIVRDVCRNVMPRNLMEAFMFTPYTVVHTNTTEEQGNFTLEDQTPELWHLNVPNYLGMTVISVLLGAAFAGVPETGGFVVELFLAISEVMLTVGQLIMWCFPIGICFLLTSQTLRSSEFVSETRQLEMYFLSLVLALAIHGMLTLPALLVVFSRAHYRSFFSNIGLTLVTAFGTSSSNITLTSTVTSLEGKVGLNTLVVRLLAPLLATLNKDGTAIYMTINTVFFAQRSGYHFTFLDLLATSAVTMIVSSATAGIPGQNETNVILTARLLSLPSQSIGILVLSDWITDRLVTVVNVLGDMVCCCIVDEQCRKYLPETAIKLDPEHANEEELQHRVATGSP
ncbi:excitatory amino acid transporter 1-like [Amblyomma americanum]